MTDRIVRVKLEGDGASLDATLAKATEGTNKLTAAVAKSGKATELSGAATSKSKNSTEAFIRALDGATTSSERLSKSSIKASQIAMGLGKAAKAAEGGFLGVAQAALAGVSALGPWGAALALAGGALVSYASGQAAAADATAKHTAELKAQKRELEKKKEQERLDKLFEKQTAQYAKERAGAQWREIESRREELEGIEDALAQHGRGKDMIALLQREAELREANLRTVGEHEQADALIRSTELEILGILGQQETAQKRITKEKEKQRGRFGPDIARTQLGMLGTPSNIDAENERRRFAAGLEASRTSELSRGDPLIQRGDERLSKRQETASLNSTEAALAKGNISVEESINAEEQAKLRHLSNLESMQAGEQHLDDMRAVRHEATLARIAEEQAAEEALMARRQSIMAATESIAASGVALGNNIAKLSGVNAKKREKIERGLGAGQAVVIGMLESVKAAAAFAQPFGVGIPEGLAHTAAAAVAFSTAAVLGSGAGGGGGRGGGGGGGGGGASQFTTGGSSPSGSRGYDGPIPGSPGPNTPTATGSGGGGGGTTNNTFIISGVIGDKRDVMRTIDEGLHQYGQQGRRRSA